MEHYELLRYRYYHELPIFITTQLSIIHYDGIAAANGGLIDASVRKVLSCMRF